MDSVEKNRLLVVAADRYPPFRVDVTVLFAKELKNRGLQIDFVFQSEKKLLKPIVKHWSNCKVFVGKAIAYKSIFSSIINSLLIFQHDLTIIMNEVRRGHYDAIVVKDKFISGITSILVSKAYGIKFIYWLSFPIPEASIVRSFDGTAKYPILYWLRGKIYELLLYKVILPKADHILVQTEEMRKQINIKGILKGKMTPVPMAVDTNEIKYYGYKKDRINNGKTVVYLGAINKFRRINFILRSFSYVLNSFPDVRLILVGGSDVKTDEEDLLKEAKRIGINKSFEITGHLPQKKALSIVKNADVCLSYIYPSPIFNVGSPTKLLEYMAMGKATVANDHPEQRVVLSESKAGICVVDDEKKFANAIIFLLKNPEIADLMGKKGRKYITEKRNYQLAANIVEQKIYKICLKG